MYRRASRERKSGAMLPFPLGPRLRLVGSAAIERRKREGSKAFASIRQSRSGAVSRPSAPLTPFVSHAFKFDKRYFESLAGGTLTFISPFLA